MSHSVHHLIWLIESALWFLEWELTSLSELAIYLVSLNSVSPYMAATMWVNSSLQGNTLKWLSLGPGGAWRSRSAPSSDRVWRLGIVHPGSWLKLLLSLSVAWSGWGGRGWRGVENASFPLQSCSSRAHCLPKNALHLNPVPMKPHLWYSLIQTYIYNTG